MTDEMPLEFFGNVDFSKVVSRLYSRRTQFRKDHRDQKPSTQYLDPVIQEPIPSEVLPKEHSWFQEPSPSPKEAVGTSCQRKRKTRTREEATRPCGGRKS